MSSSDAFRDPFFGGTQLGLTKPSAFLPNAEWPLHHSSREHQQCFGVQGSTKSGLSWAIQMMMVIPFLALLARSDANGTRHTCQGRPWSEGGPSPDDCPCHAPSTRHVCVCVTLPLNLLPPPKHPVRVLTILTAVQILHVFLEATLRHQRVDKLPTRPTPIPQAPP